MFFFGYFDYKFLFLFVFLVGMLIFVLLGFQFFMFVEEQFSIDSDYGGMDLGMYGGGYVGNFYYGNDINLLLVIVYDGL